MTRKYKTGKTEMKLWKGRTPVPGSFGVGTDGVLVAMAGTVGTAVGAAAAESVATAGTVGTAVGAAAAESVATAGTVGTVAMVGIEAGAAAVVFATVTKNAGCGRRLVAPNLHYPHTPASYMASCQALGWNQCPHKATGRGPAASLKSCARFQCRF